MTEIVISTVSIYYTSDGSISLNAPRGTELRPGQASTPLPADYNEEYHYWSSSQRKMVIDLTRYKKWAIAKIKGDAELRKMDYYTPGGAKKSEYPAKEREVNAWEGLGATLANILLAFNAMSPAQKETLFPYALADALENKDTVQAAILRFKAGIIGSAKVPKIAAHENRICKAIRDATTYEAAAAAVASLKWP